MKKVLFVGHFNDQTKQIQKELSKFVSIQLCSDNVTIAESMMGIYEPDLVVLDYEMPDCDGKETLELIRSKEATKDIPVVFLTGHGDAEHIRSVLDLNPSAYFLKPPKADKILEVLGQLL